MNKLIIIILTLASLLAYDNKGFSQNSQLSEQQAKEAVNKILQYCGMNQNFIVRENMDVKTAIAFIKNRKRYIEYNPGIIGGVMDSTNSDWSAVSILAHEVSHHLLGHTLDPASISIGDELSCDKFSGFILQSMGATIEESISAMVVCGNPHGSETHPPRSARLEAILLGWNESKNLKNHVLLSPIESKNDFAFKIQFEGDENIYYITDQNKLVWYNNYAQPIMFGEFETTQKEHFIYRLSWEDQEFFIDSENIIWNITGYEAHMKVGRLTQEN